MSKKRKNTSTSEKWDLVISADHNWFDLHLKELWRYRDLVYLFIRRDFVANYVQTILGPLWFIIQPLFSSIVYTVVFSKIARIPTDGLPPFLFYMGGSILWSYFISCFQGASNTLVANEGVFGKVYFPRLSVPLAIVISSLGKLALNFVLFFGFLIYFSYTTENKVQYNGYVIFFPVMVLQLALLGLGCGVLISALSSKYRDITYLTSFVVQLWMYVTPVVYPLSEVPEAYRSIYMLNPVSAIIEFFRLGFMGQSSITLEQIIISWGMTLCLLLIGVIIFNRIERTYIDTV